MDQAEASGKTVDDALRAALKQLGARMEQVEMTVLDEGKRGLLFGRGGRDAIVRVEWLPGEKPGGEAGGAGGGERRRGGRGRGGRTREGGAAPTEERQPRPAGRRGPQRGGGGGAGRGGGRQQRGDDFVETASPKLTEADFMRSGGSDDGAAESRPARATGERRDGGGRRSERPSRPDRPRGERRRDEEEQPVIEPNIDAEEVDFAATVVDDMLRILDIDAEISLREPVTPGDGLGSSLAVIDIMGDDLGVLIGRRGETLLNLQYLVNLMLGQRFPGKGGVTIDAEHYRHRREEEIVGKAIRMAERVKEYGDPITLEPMTPADRRLVHLALAEDDEVVTESTGDGDNRKVVILPRD